MRPLVTLGLVAIGCFASAQEDAGASVQAAIQRANGKKGVLITVGASWCKWCTRLDRFFADPLTKTILDKHYEFVRIVGFETEKNKALENPGVYDLVDWLNGRKAGLPFIAVLDSQGKLVANSLRPTDEIGVQENVGFPTNEIELKHFALMLKKGAPSLQSADLEALTELLKAPAPDQSRE